MQPIRPAGSGRSGVAATLMRSTAAPRAGLVISADVDAPSDFLPSDGAVEANLAHANGWTCEVRRDDIVLLDPLGEGLVKAPVPELPAAWLDNVRHDASCALFLTPAGAEADFAELTVAAAAAEGSLWAATVRTAVADDYGRQAPVGRNQPCPCGSGRKYKHCHG
ncbi:MAG: SEC-C domain-containing protein [Actinomycetota bacterium]